MSHRRFKGQIIAGGGEERLRQLLLDREFSYRELLLRLVGASTILQEAHQRGLNRANEAPGLVSPGTPPDWPARSSPRRPDRPRRCR